MSELKRYNAHEIHAPEFGAMVKLYRCSDIDPKLDEIAKLKALMLEAAELLERRYEEYDMADELRDAAT